MAEQPRPVDLLDWLEEHAVEPHPWKTFEPTPAQRAILRGLQGEAMAAPGDLRLEARRIGRLDAAATALAAELLLGGSPTIVAASEESAEALADRALAKARELLKSLPAPASATLEHFDEVDLGGDAA